MRSNDVVNEKIPIGKRVVGIVGEGFEHFHSVQLIEAATGYGKVFVVCALDTKIAVHEQKRRTACRKSIATNESSGECSNS